MVETHMREAGMFNELGQIRLPPKTQGQDANISGALLEMSLLNAFKMRGVPAMPYRGEQVEDLFLEKTVRLNVPYTNIYGGKSRTELVYYHGNGLIVRIECRAQTRGGSIDEKFPYLIECAKRIKEPAVWLVLGGDGARLRAIYWLKRTAHSYDKKIIRVYTEQEARTAIKALVENGKADMLPKPRRHPRHSNLTE